MVRSGPAQGRAGELGAVRPEPTRGDRAVAILGSQAGRDRRQGNREGHRPNEACERPRADPARERRGTLHGHSARRRAQRRHRYRRRRRRRCRASRGHDAEGRRYRPILDPGSYRCGSAARIRRGRSVRCTAHLAGGGGALRRAGDAVQEPGDQQARQVPEPRARQARRQLRRPRRLQLLGDRHLKRLAEPHPDRRSLRVRRGRHQPVRDEPRLRPRLQQRQPVLTGTGPGRTRSRPRAGFAGVRSTTTSR